MTEQLLAETGRPGLEVTSPIGPARRLGHIISRAAPRYLWLAALCLAVLTVILAIVHLRHNEVDRDATAAQAVGRKHVAQLLSYDYRTIDAKLAEQRPWLTGPFSDKYATLVTGKIAPAAQRAEVQTRAQVVAAGVESATKHHVQLLLFLNVAAVSKAHAQQPQITGSRLRVTMEYVNGAWRISALDPV